MNLTNNKAFNDTCNIEKKAKTRKIDIELIKQKVNKDVIDNLLEEEKEAFYGTPKYFRTFKKNKKGKKKRALSKNAEIKLGKILEAYKNGSDENLEQVVIAYNKLFKYNQIKAYKQVWFFLKSNNIFFYDFNNAIQDALLELHRGIIEYDTSRNTSLYTRVYYLVRKALSVGADASRDIPIPQKAGNKIYVINNIINDYRKENDITPSTEYIINTAKEDFDIRLVPNEIETLLAIQEGFFSYDFTTLSSIESGSKSNSQKIANFSDTVEDINSYMQFEAIETNAQLEDLLSCLTEKEKIVIFHYFKIDNKYYDYTKQELADKLGISVYKLRKSVDKALEKLQKFAKSRDTN